MGKPWKTIILAGGTGSRLYPLTHAVNKHLLPIYDKPMIYYPLSIMMLVGMRDFVLISSPDALPQLQRLLGDGSQWGVQFTYRAQERPGGIAQCFEIAADDIEGANVALILGDNIFYGSGLPEHISAAITYDGATIFGYEVANPSAFGVVTLDADDRPLALVEKPETPQSNLAVPGLYFYDDQVLEIARTLTPSARGELEITDVNKAYLAMGKLNVSRLNRGTAWLDGGSHSALYEAGQFIKVVEERTGLKIACPEEIAYRKGFISKPEFMALVDDGLDTEYQAYLRRIAREIG
ncbi:MAG: glucose-1-phosphate thymidylyltransferase RfbA [Robiginitomaculum sp.]|nr:glucose-1-phosphate thymidylyltransferase RfbA [Robiginitomaculum sp.]MDQ7076362.1 glucose-1-phosphate thymidylyltransferase RfbA [Robiginitomaculum sp.]